MIEISIVSFNILCLIISMTFLVTGIVYHKVNSNSDIGILTIFISSLALFGTLATLLMNPDVVRWV